MYNIKDDAFTLCSDIYDNCIVYDTIYIYEYDHDK